MEQELSTDFNHTTRHVTTSSPAAATGVYYTLVPFVLLTLLGCVVAVVREAAPQASLQLLPAPKLSLKTVLLLFQVVYIRRRVR